MLAAVNGYFDGTKIVMSENVNLKKGQRVIVTILDEEMPADAAVSDAEVDAISERLLRQNHEAYEVLAQ